MIDASCRQQGATGGRDRQDIIERTDGIPLFVEEMTKAVLEAESEGEARRTAAAVPSPALAVPASLHASLMARLDRLGPAKEVAQIGAAIGREFSHALLAAVVRKPEAELESALDRLIAAGLLFRQGVPPHATYLFKHALVQDAAYGTLLREPRRALHARIAETLESQFAEIAENQPELLARHCTEAGLIEKAAGLWGKAGQRSLERSALVEAVEQLTRALDQIATLPATPALRREQIKLQVALITPLMHVKGYAAPETKAAVGAGTSADRTSRSARRASRRPAAVVLGPLRLLGRELCGVQRRRDARACGAVPGARREARGDGPAHDRASPHGHFLDVYGRHRGRRERISIGRSRFTILPSIVRWRRVLAQTLGWQSCPIGRVALWLLGYPEAALADAEHALKDAREIGQAATLMYALSCGSVSLISHAEIMQQQTRIVDELIALADEKGALYWKAVGMMSRGWVLALTGKASDAVQMITSGITACRSTGATVCDAVVFIVFGEGLCGTRPIR